MVNNQSNTVAKSLGQKAKDFLRSLFTEDRLFTFTIVRPALKKLITWEIVLVVIVVLAWSYATSYAYDTLVTWFPKLQVAQLWFHQKLFHSDSRKSHVKWVTVVEVDDDTFYKPPISGSTPTNRRFLGDLALRAAEHNAAAIAIDFQLKGMAGSPGDAAARSEDNHYLLEAIGLIVAKGIPVVLTTGLRPIQNDEWQRQANIYLDSELPPGAEVGHMNLPKDLRKVAMGVMAWNWNHSDETKVKSFALQAVDRYEAVLGVQPKSLEDETIVKSENNNDWVFGGFFEPNAFPRISARSLWAGDRDAGERCRHRIVLIGGTWHTQTGSLIDASPSTIGYVPSVYLHANYIEAVLDNRFKPGVPEWLTMFLDFLLAILMYLSFHAVNKTPKRVGVLFAFLLPLVIVYIGFANAGRYLDFVLPLSLCFIHLGVKLAF